MVQNRAMHHWLNKQLPSLMLNSDQVESFPRENLSENRKCEVIILDYQATGKNLLRK